MTKGLGAVLAAFIALGFAGGADAAPRCHGAAARDTVKRCVSTTTRVTPTPDEAATTPNVACVKTSTEGACAYGAADPVATVALLGDSHAAHWRAALDVVAKAKRWRVIEFARPHCPFSNLAPASTEPGSRECGPYNASVLAWLAEHPEVATVFVSNNARLAMADRTLSGRVRGVLGAIGALPSSVTRTYALRDTPTDLVTTHDCVREAVAARENAGTECALPRRRALVHDPTTIAAERMGFRGGRVIDLSSFFCSSRECFPVVGGVLVRKDQDHLTQAFATTLGPYILRALNRTR